MMGTNEESPPVVRQMGFECGNAVRGTLLFLFGFGFCVDNRCGGDGGFLSGGLLLTEDGGEAFAVLLVLAHAHANDAHGYTLCE